MLKLANRNTQVFIKHQITHRVAQNESYEFIIDTFSQA